MPHPLPRIQFKIIQNLLFRTIHETPLHGMESEIFNKNRVRFQSRLMAGILEVQHSLRIFQVLFHTAKINARVACWKFLPRINQAFVDTIKLVALWKKILKPIPLRNRRFDERGRCVRIVFE